MNQIPLRKAVYALMAQLPADKVTTYGDLAAYAGHPGASRIVGAIAHGGPEHLPWHRLVYSNGRVATGFPGGAEVQRQLLRQDGILCDDAGIVQDFARRRWKFDR